jgi:hypothetical protein
MKADEHREKAESLLAKAEEGGSPTYVASLERRAIAHAVLSLPDTRAPRGGVDASTDLPEVPRPARKKPGPKPRPKKSTTSTKEKDA